MLTTTKHVIHDRSEPIIIKQNLASVVKTHSLNNEYSLTHNIFDPTKSSPPNNFMIKLHMRMNKYYFDNDDDKFEIK